MTQPEKTATALEKSIDIALEYGDNPVSAVGLLECAKMEIMEMTKKKRPAYEGLVN